MLKTLALIVRRPDWEREAFRRHYEEVHSPLALPALEGLVRYVKYHLEADLHGRARFDVISAFWFADVEAAMATLRRLEGPAGDAIRRDERSFMHRERNVSFAVGERALADGEEGGAGSRQAFVLLKAPGDGVEGYVGGFAGRAWPGLAAAFGAPRFALVHRSLSLAEPPPFDLVLQLREDADCDARALAAWAAEEEARGARVLAVRTRLHETDTLWEAPRRASPRTGC